MNIEQTVLALCEATTRDEAGRHFTEWMSNYGELENAGLIEITRPVHNKTGIPYDQQYWILTVTEDGLDLIDQNTEFIPSN